MIFTPLEHQSIAGTFLTTHDISVLGMGCGLGKTSTVLQFISDLFLDGASKGVLIVAPLRVANLTWSAEKEKWDQFNWIPMYSLRQRAGIEAWERGEFGVYLINYEMLTSRDVQVTVPRKITEEEAHWVSVGMLPKNYKPKRSRQPTEVEFDAMRKGKLDPWKQFDAKRPSKALGFCDKYMLGKKSIPVDTVIFDELTFLKSHTHQGAKAFALNRHFFKRFIGLTGTLASQGYMDLFGMYLALDGGQRLGRYITHFRANYFSKSEYSYEYKLLPGAKERIQELIGDMTLVLRSEDYLNIPETVHIDIDVDLPPPLRKQYDELEKKLLLTIDDREIVASNAAVLSGKLLQFVSGAVYDADRDVVHIHDLKIEALRKLKDKLKKPMLVVVSYLHEKDRIINAIPGAELFDEKRLDAWNAGEIPMWVIHPRSAGHGLNMAQGGSVVVWFTLNHSRELFDQTNARLIRTGQNDVTTIYRIMGVDTYDWAVAESLRNLGDSQHGLLMSLKNLRRLRSKPAA